MPRADFYLIAKPRFLTEPLKLVCELARKANDAGQYTLVLARDAAADGRFVYAVRTTGVYCRPSCPSRRARAENVRFYASGAEAEAAFKDIRKDHIR